MNHVSIIIIIIIIIIKKIKTKIKKGKAIVKRERKRVCIERFLFFYFLLFASFSDLWKSDCRIFSEEKAKFIHASRATRGYQNHGVLSNSTR